MLIQPDSLVYFKNRFVQASEVRLPFLSSTFHYGYGVFEGIRSYETQQGPRMFKPQAHFNRLLKGAEQLGLALPHSPEELTAVSYTLIQKNGLRDAYVRPLVFEDTNMSLVVKGQPMLLIACWKWGPLLGDQQVHLSTSRYRRPNRPSELAEYKVCGFYAETIRAKTEAKSKGCQDALMLDEAGRVLGTTGANIFIEKNEVLYTPPAHNIIPGVTRTTVFELSQELGIDIVEKDLYLEDLIQSDGVFLSGTATEIAGVASLDGRGFTMEWEDTLGHLISRTYRRLVTEMDLQPATLI